MTNWQASPPTIRSHPFCGTVLKSSPAISRCRTTISPGRPSVAATRRRAKARFRPISNRRALRGDPRQCRSRQRSSRKLHRAARRRAGRLARPLYPAGCTGLDDGPATERSLGRDQPHGPRRRPGDFPHRGRKEHHRGRLSPAIRDQWTYMEERSTRADGASIARRSMAASISTGRQREQASTSSRSSQDDSHADPDGRHVSLSAPHL